MLLPDELPQCPIDNLRFAGMGPQTGIDGTVAIRHDAFAVDVGNKPDDGTVRGITQEDARVHTRVGFSILRGDVQGVIRTSIEIPLGRPNRVSSSNRRPSRSENLYPNILAIGNEQPSLGVHRQRVRQIEFPRPGAGLAPLHDELTVR